ncbi:hypothetical protein ACEWY4_002609 [Coilia grayii]|uniref:E3 ubiquitin/ISG15 ligase TRIM25-like n=1 Tax=Coilia grayii TaxID=363190 RepID=A0ABD1KPW1_9TELE
MAENSSVLSYDQITCPICLGTLDDPVTIPCGHTYCYGCIKRFWDDKDQTGKYRCPECRASFDTRPALNKNTMFADVVEKLRETGLEPVPTEDEYAGAEDADCSICTGRKLKAVQSCLTCLASYCESHIHLHNKLRAGSKHKVVKANANLKESICSTHEKLLEVYCNTDSQFICFLCAMDKHKGHDTISVSESAEKQRLLGVAQMKSQEAIQRKQMEAQDLRKAIDSLKKSAQTSVEECERVFLELVHSAERRCAEVTKRIREREEAELRRASGILEELERDISERKERASEISKLSDMNDHIDFVLSFPTLCGPAESEHPTSTIITDICSSFPKLKKSVSDLQKQLEEFCKQEMDKLSEGETERDTRKPLVHKRLSSSKKASREAVDEPACEARQDEQHWRRQKSEERARAQQTPPAPWRRRRTSSEEVWRQDSGRALPEWRREAFERRGREASPEAQRSRAPNRHSWRQQPH